MKEFQTSIRRLFTCSWCGLKTRNLEHRLKYTLAERGRLFILAALASCASPAPPPQHNEDISRRIFLEWKSLTKRSEISECLLKISIPNPISPSDYRVMRDTLERSESTKQVVFWLFPKEMVDYVLLQRSCEERSKLAEEIQQQLLEKGINASVSPVERKEADRAFPESR